jgi:hypothetical protein
MSEKMPFTYTACYLQKKNRTGARKKQISTSGKVLLRCTPLWSSSSTSSRCHQQQNDFQGLKRQRPHRQQQSRSLIRKICKGRTKDGEGKNNRLMSITRGYAQGRLHLETNSLHISWKYVPKNGIATL